MGAFSRVVTALVSGLSLLDTTLALSYGFPYGSQKIRGVNLGGWLVLEVSASSLQRDASYHVGSL